MKKPMPDNEFMKLYDEAKRISTNSDSNGD